MAKAKTAHNVTANANATLAITNATNRKANAPTPSNAHKYGQGFGNLPASVANGKFTLTAAGAKAAAQIAAGGKVTVMGMVCYLAAKLGATATAPVSGVALVAAMRASSFAKQAYGQTRTGKYAPKGSLPCAAWCSGYVAGAARTAHGLLAKA